MKISKKFAFFVFLVILPTAAMLGPGRPAAAQQAGQSATDSKTTAKERRVIILGTTIVGSVAGPRVVYEEATRGLEKKTGATPTQFLRGNFQAPGQRTL